MRLAPLVAAVSAATLLVAACSSGDGTTPAGDDAGTTADAATPLDAAGDAVANDDAAPAPDAAATGCGEFAGDTRYTCSKDGDSRGRCVDDASADVETCARGCLRDQPPADDVCMGTTTSWTCPGSYGTAKAQDGDYYLTGFGCWVDANNGVHTDPGDNCIPACLSKARSSGLCGANDTGPACEEKVDWFVADSGRFGCLARLRVENPQNQKKVIVAVLDAGPACSVESKVQKAVLDASGRVDDYLFGSQQGYSDKALVHVVEVDPSTPLGPVP